MNFLHGKDSAQNFEHLSFSQKLDYIDGHEVELFTGKPKKKDQVEGEEGPKDDEKDPSRKRLRLVGVTLSYDLYES